MAHTLARLVYRMLKFGHHYVDLGIEYYEAKYRQQQLRWTAKQAAALNMQLVPLPELEVEFLELLVHRLATFRRKNALSDVGRLTSCAADMVLGGDFALVHSRARGELTVPA